MRFLDARADRAEVLRLWDATGSQPFAHPDYLDIFSDSGPAGILTARVDEVDWVLPLIMRDLHELDAGVEGYDASSPYGYGGPYGSVPGAAPRAVLAQAAQWARAHAVASAFLRLDVGVPLREGRLIEDAEIRTVSENVVVDLSVDDHKRWAGYPPKVRNGVRRALREGCTASRVDAMSHLPDFMKVYRATMQRRDADAFYWFSRDTFERLFLGLGESASVYLVRDGHDEVVSVELVLESNSTAYSFLGGTLEDSFWMRPNELLKHSIFEDLAARGRRRMVLGGGYAGRDGLFRYKRSFARHGVRPFQVARVVGDRERYDQVMRAVGVSAEEPADSDFFPAYRGGRA